MWQKSGKKVVKSGTSPLRKVWKSLSAIQDTNRSSKTLRNLLQERLSITRNFESDLPVLKVMSRDCSLASDLVKAVCWTVRERERSKKLILHRVPTLHC